MTTFTWQAPKGVEEEAPQSGLAYANAACSGHQHHPNLWQGYNVEKDLQQWSHCRRGFFRYLHVFLLFKLQALFD